MTLGETSEDLYWKEVSNKAWELPVSNYCDRDLADDGEKPFKLSRKLCFELVWNDFGNGFRTMSVAVCWAEVGGVVHTHGQRSFTRPTGEDSIPLNTRVARPLVIGQKEAT
ncbi:hypothetical protein Tco_0053416 [Tanacetum coccineum]